MAEVICAIVCAVLAIIALVISAMSFMEKGFLFNNAYIWASKQEREAMNKKQYYKQSAIAFAMATAILLCMAFEFVLQTAWLWLAVGALCLVLLVYAIKSSTSSTKE